MIVCINLDMSSKFFNIALSFSLITYVMFFYMNLWIKICWKILLISTIQKPDFRTFSATGSAAALKPTIFYGANYKRWRAKMILWLTAMNVYHVALGKPVGPLTSNEDSAFEAADNLFRGTVISVLG